MVPSVSTSIASTRTAMAAPTPSTTSSSSTSQHTNGRRRGRQNHHHHPMAMSCAVDFSMLTLESLRKYKRVHKLRIKPTLSKAELVKVVTEHFQSEPPQVTIGIGAEGNDLTLDEEKMIDAFVMAVRQHRSVNGHVAEKNDGKTHKRKKNTSMTTNNKNQRKKSKRRPSSTSSSSSTSPSSSASTDS